MMHRDDLLWALDWNHQTLLRLTADLADDDLARQPVEAMNHPAWLVGHLSVYHAVVVAMCAGQTFTNPWDQPYGKNSQPSPERSVYPAKSALMSMYETGHAQAVEAIAHASAEAFAAAIPHDTWGKAFSIVGRAVTFLATNHFAYHVGQLSGWRRAMALPKV